jgi:hypothetical protein
MAKTASLSTILAGKQNSQVNEPSELPTSKLTAKDLSDADLPIFSSGSCLHPCLVLPTGPLSHNALTGS